MKIILASQSPKRKDLLEQMGLKFEVIESQAEETFEEGLSLEEQSKKLAYIKAKTVFNKTFGDRIVIGADTMIIKDGVLYGKPKDKEDAIRMLKILKKTAHKAITSLCVLVEKNGEYKEHIIIDTTKVFFKDMTDEEILNWIKIGNPYNKSGAYALQSPFCVFVEKVEGNFNTVQGLPTHKLYDILKLYL